MCFTNLREEDSGSFQKPQLHSLNLSQKEDLSPEKVGDELRALAQRGQGPSALSAALSLAATSVDKGECVGGATLSLLHDRSFSYTGDSQAQELCLYLTTAASVPYFEILEKWIYRGIIDDPYRWGEGPHDGE